VLITCIPTLESPNPSGATIHDTDYDRSQTTEGYEIGIFEMFAWFDTYDARCKKQFHYRPGVALRVPGS